MKPHKGIIEDWKEIHYSLDQLVGEYTNTLGYAILGRPEGHPNFVDWIRTSPLVKRVENEVETMNSRYTLGKPHSQVPT